MGGKKQAVERYKSYAAAITFSEQDGRLLINQKNQNCWQHNHCTVFWSWDAGGEKENIEKFTLWDIHPVLQSYPSPVTPPRRKLWPTSSLMDITHRWSSVLKPSHLDGQASAPNQTKCSKTPVISSHQPLDRCLLQVMLYEPKLRYIYYPDIGLDSCTSSNDPNEGTIRL